MKDSDLCPSCNSGNIMYNSSPYFSLKDARKGDDVESLCECLDCEKPFVIIYTQKRIVKINESTRFC